MISSLFVDASAWIALFNKDDRYYEKAMAFWEQIPEARLHLVTNDYVMDETYTFLRKSQNGLNRAIQAYEVVEKSGLIELVEVNDDYRRRGWLLFTKYTDKVISFTDCVCFAMMHELGVYQVFSFDADFARAGFVVRP